MSLQQAATLVRAHPWWAHRGAAAHHCFRANLALRSYLLRLSNARATPADTGSSLPLTGWIMPKWA